MEERRSYSKEFKLDAIELSKSYNKSVKEIAADLGIPYKLLCVWVWHLIYNVNCRLVVKYYFIGCSL